MPCRHHQRIKHLSLRHQRKHQHTHHQNKPQHYHHHHHHQLPQDLKGKSTTCSSSHLPTAVAPVACSPATPPPPNLPSSAATAAAAACAYVSSSPSAAEALATGSGSGGSLTNLSTGNEPEFEPCPCDECFACAPPSTSATASTLLADECYSQTASSMLSATRCALSTVAAIATGSGLGGGPSTSAAAAAASASSASSAGAVSHPAPSSCSTLCSSAYFSTSAPTTSSSVHSSMSRSNSKRLNNNTCSINNNKLSFRSGSGHVSQLHLPTHQQAHHHAVPVPGSGPLQSPTQKSVSEDEGEAAPPDDGGNGQETDEDPKSPHSVQSDLSETFDWWFNKPKRNSKKSRYLIIALLATCRTLPKKQKNNKIASTPQTKINQNPELKAKSPAVIPLSCPPKKITLYMPRRHDV